MKLTDALKARHTVAPIPSSLTERLTKMADASDAKRSKKTLHRRRFIALTTTGMIGLTVAGTAPHIPYALKLQAAAKALHQVQAVKIITETYSPETQAWRAFGETFEGNGRTFTQDTDSILLTTPTQAWRAYPGWDIALVETNPHYGGVGSAGLTKLAQSLEKTPWIALLPTTNLSQDEDDATYTIRLEDKNPLLSLGNQPYRLVWVLEKKTNRVLTQSFEMRLPGQGWQARSRQRYLYDTPSLPASFPAQDSLEAGRIIDLPKERDTWLRAHQTPLAEKDGIRLLDVQRSQQGDVYVIYDAGKDVIQATITSVSDDIGTTYLTAHRIPLAPGLLTRNFSPSTGLLGRNGQVEAWSGFSLEGRGLFGEGIVSLKPTDTPRTLTLTVQVTGVQSRTTTFTVALPTAACEEVPEHMPLLSTFPHSPTELKRNRANLRATYYSAQRQWSDALTQLDQARTLAPDKTEKDVRWWFQRAEVLEGLGRHDDAKEAQERAKAAPEGHVDILRPGGKVERK